MRVPDTAFSIAFFLEDIFYLCYGFFSLFFIFILNLNEKDPLDREGNRLFFSSEVPPDNKCCFRGNY